MSDQRPSSNQWLDAWKTTVSGVVALTAIVACAGLLFTALAFTQGGAQLSVGDISLSIPAQPGEVTLAEGADPPPVLEPVPFAPPPPAPPAPPAPPVARVTVPFLGIVYTESTQTVEGESGERPTVRLWDIHGHPGVRELDVDPHIRRFAFSPDGRALTIERSGVQVCSARVRYVYPGSPADAAGLKAEDMIVSVDGRPLFEGKELQRIIRGAAVGKTVTLGVYRNDRRIQLSATLGAIPLTEE